MSLHLVLPYGWLECNAGNVCMKAVHCDETSVNVKAFPQVWVESLLGFGVEVEEEYNEEIIVFRAADGTIHRDDGPAVEWLDGTLQWYQRGNLHRAEGPAVMMTDGGKQWWVDGAMHRLDGPANIYGSGEEFWYVNGLACSVYGPAVSPTEK